MSDRPSGNNYITESDILSLNEVKCCGKVVFTANRKISIPYTIQLPKDSNGDYVRAYMYDKTSVLKKWRCVNGTPQDSGFHLCRGNKSSNTYFRRYD